MSIEGDNQEWPPDFVADLFRLRHSLRANIRITAHLYNASPLNARHDRLRFPGVPAIYLCHAWISFEAFPPRFPRILRYIAMDDTCRDRLLFQEGVSEVQVKVLLNAVDLKRFHSRGPLPDHPRRALVFSNNAGRYDYLDAVRAACHRGQA